VGAPFIIAAITFLLGAVLLALSLPRYREYFSRKPSIVDPKVLEPTVPGEQRPGAPV
jgi:hypothetical protein